MVSYIGETHLLMKLQNLLNEMVRSLGTRTLTLDQLKKIVELTLKGNDNPNSISDKVDCGQRTVIRIQSQLDLR
jgi:hypothetical protein